MDRQLADAGYTPAFFRNAKKNRANERDSKDFYGHGWGFAWPSDRRILYNRASARPDGKPWSERKKLVWWDAEASKWTGLDVPDFIATKAPDTNRPANAIGDDALAGDKPFILHADGFGWIWVPTGLNDGPLPAHYEPLESPVRNPMYPSRQTNPAANGRTRAGNEYATSPDNRFPYVLTTYRLTEHHTAGGMSRTLSHLAELQPELFCEFRLNWRQELSIMTGEWVTDRHVARSHRSACLDHAPHAVAHSRTARPCTGWAALPLGVFWSWSRATSETT